MNKAFLRLLCLGLFILFAAPSPVDARVDILPRKVVIEPRERSGEVTILNVFDKPGLYRIKAINYRQNEDGEYELLDAPLSSNFDPSQHVRISPKQFEVAPQGRQKIRISVRKPQDLPDGEYRFHLVATRYDTAAQEAEENNSGNVMVQMRMNLGVSIPVVVRHGEVGVSTQIQDISHTPPGTSKITSAAGGDLSMTVAREGNIGTVGKVSIFAGSEKIGSLSNFNVFSEVSKRIVTIPLKKDPRGLGPIRIVYENDNGDIFNETTVQF